MFHCSRHGSLQDTWDSCGGWGSLFESPHKWDYKILGFVAGTPIDGNPQVGGCRIIGPKYGAVNLGFSLFVPCLGVV